MSRTLRTVCICFAAAFLLWAVTAAMLPQADTLREQPEESGGELPASEHPAEPVRALSAEKIGWGLGPAKNELGIPLDAATAQSRYAEYGAAFYLPDAGRTVWLTFDLGYENGYTASIIDTLNAHGVQGTFFVTMDYLKEAPEVVQKILDSGHVLANHSLTHPSFPGLSAAQAAEEITAVHEYVLEQYDYEMTLFRYPMGEFSEQRLSELAALGYRAVFWSFAYKDWVTDSQPDPGASLEKLLAAAHPGAIYLLHAVSSTNDAILGDLITGLQEQGYRFYRVEQAREAEGILP